MTNSYDVDHGLSQCHPGALEPIELPKVAAQQFRKKPVVVQASQWFKNGDHPLDYSKTHDGLENGELRRFSPEERRANGWEGDIVRYYRHPDDSGERPCQHCGNTMHVHGWIDTKEGGHIVCPGDWIVTGVQGERYPCKPDIFAATYEAAAPGVSTVEKRRPARDWELTCHECDGSGHVYVKHQVAERKTDVQEFKEECECCEGRGFVFAFQDIPGIEEYVKACRPAPAGVSTVEAVDTQNLRKLLERATPGPWTWKQVGTFSTPGVALFWPDTSKGGVHYRRLDSNGGITEADAELITNAVRALPALLDEALAAQRKGD
ncbi:PGDYG domain-containing protein, partial [Achromobacter ruhlandii]|uniref:PGDYG domain-containing protein n=1 Tax=Achromobacter ruhlandii TaxID=72557 RepID=UPI001C2EEB52